MRTFFQQLPSSLFESAKIDGSSEFRIYTNIVIPLSKPVIATVAFLGLLGRWNDWFNPKLYINDYNLYPVQYLLQSMLANVQFALDMMKNVPAIDFDTRSIPRENLRMAMMVVSVLPMMFVFLFFQKYFVKGLTVGSIKG
jgi:ABC-type sugar transport system, permease component